MARPSKPANVIRLENVSHRTKRELASRERAESELLTGRKMREFPETRESQVAHAEFRRISKLLECIGKNDDLYANSINRYCQLHAEVDSMRAQIEYFEKQLQEMETGKAEFSDLGNYYKTVCEMQKVLVNIDKQIQSKRSMMLAIEKENVLTISSALRSVPKQPETQKSALLEALADDG